MLYAISDIGSEQRGYGEKEKNIEDTDISEKSLTRNVWTSF